MKKIFVLIFAFSLFIIDGNAQGYIVKVCKVETMPFLSYDQHGNEIALVYEAVKLKPGEYHVSLSDYGYGFFSIGSLTTLAIPYEKGAQYFLKFSTEAHPQKEGTLVVKEYGQEAIYKEDNSGQ